MLVIKRIPKETAELGSVVTIGPIKVQVLRVHGKIVTIGIEAPRELDILRDDARERTRNEKRTVTAVPEVRPEETSGQ